MSIGRMVVREILFRKLGFLLSVVAVAAAVGCLVNQFLLLEEHDRRTELDLAKTERATKQEMGNLQDEIRIITKNLGFNVRILPKNLNLRDFHTKDYADSFMPEEYATRLTQARVVTINHLMPILQQRLAWTEQNDLPIILIGTRGEVPLRYQDKKKPIQAAVPPGKIVLGHWPGQGYKRGDRLVLRGRAFTVADVHAERGGDDDKSVWINLKEAQDMAGKPGQINGMLALGCNCTSARLSVIRDEIAALLPDTQVEEFASIAKARAEARTKVADEAAAALARDRAHAAAWRKEWEAFASALVSVVLLAACVCVGLLALGNVRQRRGEIGLLRALGVRSGQLFALFMARALIVGLVGTVLGCLAGALSIALMGDGWDEAFTTLVDQTPFLLSVLLAAPALSLIACWLPTLLAVRQDPALILQQEP